MPVVSIKSAEQQAVFVDSSGASGAGKQMDGAVQSNSRFAHQVWIRVTGGAALTAPLVRSRGTASILRFPGLQGL